MIDRSVAIKRVRTLKDGTTNPKYCGKHILCIHRFSVNQIKTHIAYYIHQAKKLHPIFAYKLLKIIAVLSVKKSRFSPWGNYKFYNLTEHDIPDNGFTIQNV